MGPVVQSIISLTSSLRGQLIKFYDFITKYTDIFDEKNERNFCSAKASPIISPKILACLRYNFEILTKCQLMMLILNNLALMFIN